MGSSCPCSSKPIDTELEIDFLDLIPKVIQDKMENEKDLLDYESNNKKIKTIKLKNSTITNDDEMIYKGELNNKYEKEGIGKLVIINSKNERKFYYGIWKKNELIKGVIYYSNNIMYKGDIKNYMRNGKGIYITENETYNGDWKEDQKDGEGLLKYKNGPEYKGQFITDKFNGKGELKWPDGTYYKGDFCNNIVHGEGYLKGSNGHIYNGNFNWGVFNGYGEFIWAKGVYSVKYKGNYCSGKKDGKGEFYFDNGNVYKGGWESGTPHGEGIFETKNRKYYGNWRSGFFMQLIKVENKENSKEENVNLNFWIPNEDIEIKGNFKLSQISISSSTYNTYNDVIVEIIKPN